MPKKFSFNIPLYTQAVTDRLVSAVVDTTNEVYFEILKNSPVDTGKFIQDNRNEWVRQEWDTIIWRVTNEWEYSEKVEWWWRKTPVNWHLRSGQIYYDIWAHPFEKSLKKVEQNFIKKLQLKLW